MTKAARQQWAACISASLTMRAQPAPMRFPPLIIAAVLLAACNTPSPAFRGLPAIRVTVAGSTFDVRQRGLRAEAMRINPQYAPRFGPLQDRAAFAMAQASGCEVVRVTGDQALAFGTLDCGDGPPSPRRDPVDIECVPVRGSEIQEFGGGLRIDLDCAPA